MGGTHKIFADIDVDGEVKGTSLDLNGNAQIDGTITVGVDDTGYDVKFFGATSGRYMMWDESSDRLELTDNTKIKFGDDADGEIYHSGSNLFIGNATGDINIINSTDNGDIKFQSDDGLGGNTEYFKLDGSLAGGDGAGTLFTIWEDNSRIGLGANADLRMYHDGSNSQVINLTGNLIFDQRTDDADIIFKSDNGSGGTTAYLTLDGSLTQMWADKDLQFSDSIKAKFGASSDLQIYHNGSHSYLDHTGTGAFYIRTKNNSSIYLQDTNGQAMAQFTDGGGSHLYYNNSLKISTTNTGIDVTGEVKGDSLDIDGSADISGGIASGDRITITRDSDALRLNSSSSNGTYLGFQNNGTFKGYIGSAYHLFSSPANNADHLGFRAETQHTFGIQATPIQKITTSGIDITGTITASGQITGTELEGTSLDINGNADISGTLDVNGTLQAKNGQFYVMSTANDTHTNLKLKSNGTEGVFMVHNNSNWGLIARGVSNNPRLGAYHNGTLDIYGFGNNEGADHADDDLLARFNFSNESFQVNGALDINGSADISGNLTGVDTLTATTFSGDLNGTINSSTTATTQSASNNSTKVATTAYVDAQVATVVDSAPGTLNTLNELAAALGDDASFSTTVTNSIAAKLPLAGGTMTGAITMSTADDHINFDVNNAAIFDNSNNNNAYYIRNGGTNAATLQMGTGSSPGSNIKLTLDSSGNATFAGNVTANGTVLTGDQDLSSYITQTNADARYVLETGGSSSAMTGDLHIIAGAPKIILQDNTDDDDHQIVFRNNGNGDDYKITTSDFTSASTGDGLFIGSESGDPVKLVTNDTIALTLDTSQNATFAGDVTVGDDVFIADGGIINIGSGNDMILFHDATDSVIRNSTGHLYFDNLAQDKDIYIRGNDNGSTITALWLDMSDAGSAYFNSWIWTGNGGIGRDAHNLIDFSTDNQVTFKINNINQLVLNQSRLAPSTNDGSILGSASLGWSDLFLASGAVVNFNNGDVTLTHASNQLTVAGGTFITGNIEVSDIDIGGTATGDGSGLTDLNGSEITTGTVAAARVATLNQNTTGSSGSCTGNAATATTAALATQSTIVANNSANETCYPVFVDGATGAQGLETDTGWTFNPSTGTLTTQKIATDVASIVENNKDGSALMTLTGQGAGNESNISLKMLGTSNGNPIKMKMVALNDSGSQVGAGLLSYDAEDDSFGIGQSSSHNRMAIKMENTITSPVDGSTYVYYEPTSIKAREYVASSNSSHYDFNGDIMRNGNDTTVRGKMYVFKNGTWTITNADTKLDSNGLLGLALGTNSTTHGMLLKGTFTLDYDPGGAGNPLYISTTDGVVSTTVPSTSGHIVRLVGYLIGGTHGTMFFDPDKTYVEVA